jgi:peptide/nickel transport system ATP-binding protein
VPQNPRAALDPRCTVGEQVAEPLVIHRLARSEADLVAARRQAFDAVGLSESLLNRYPHQLSGGQRQRVVLARALTLNPKLIVMDEPTSALDVSVQAQVMQLIAALKAEYGLTYVFISHDLRNLALIADQIAVMYAGRVVEQGSVAQVCSRPAHPYTQALLAAVPDLGGVAPIRAPVRGDPPDPAALPSGCAFHPRCSRAIADCSQLVPALRQVPDGRRVACPVVAADAVAP